jgi:signal transduction histidine kinase/ligand-binding sensor domain-containing protein
MWIRSHRLGWLLATSLALSLVVGAGEATAWVPFSEASNFHHTAWTSRDGIGAVFDIQQASDGFLWLTTSEGVFRFDGVSFQSVEEATNGAVPKGEVSSFYLASTGGVWLTTRNQGLLFWKNGRLTAFNDRRCTPAFNSEGMAEDRDGALWVQAGSGLFRVEGLTCKQIGPFPAGLLVDRNGTLWIETPAGSLLYLPRGQSNFRFSQAGEGPTLYQSFLHQAPNGSIWLSDDHGLRRVTDAKGAPTPSSQQGNGPSRFRCADFTFADDGSLWAPTTAGLERLPPAIQSSRVPRWETTPGASFSPEQGLSSDIVRKVFIDREASVWVGTNSGLDRLRRTALTPIAIPHQHDDQLAIAPGDKDSVWIGSSNLPLTHLMADGSRIGFPETGQITCIRTDRNGDIWVAGRGKFHLWRYAAARLIPRHYRNEKMESVTSVAVDRNHAPWISTLWPEVYQFVHGGWEKRNGTLGKPPGFLGAMSSDEKGNVWFAFPGTLVKWDGRHYHRFTEPAGMPWLLVTTLAAHGDHLWLGGQGGLEFFSKGVFHTMRWKDPDMPGRVSGVVETETGDLWINGFSGVTHVSAGELQRWIRDPTSVITGERLNALDGLPGLSVERYPEPSIIESRDHRLWFATTKGVAWLDPAAVEKNRNRLPPPVAIYSIISNGKVHATSNGLTLPARNKTIEIDYTALSLAVPERVLFRYRLDGIDNEWQDVGTRRQAFYTSLPPGPYRFHVIACNNDGLWNEEGAALEFSILPAFYQTAWFRLSCAVALLALLGALYRLRLRQVARQFNIRLEERVCERTRIARELHDTLLQSFQGLMLRLQVVDELLPEGKAKEQLEQTLKRADQAISEGRSAVYDLRSSTMTGNDLAQAVRALGDELAAQDEAAFRLTVEGQPCDMHPIVRDELYRITREALRNAFSHARAHNIEVEITYAERLFRLRIRDDGEGVAPEILKRGHPGHYGLAGMGERARQIGAKLSIWSRAGAGTEIELSIPGSHAYGRSPKRSRWRLFREKGG